MKYQLKDFISSQYIINHGYFSHTGSAKSTYNHYILCYAVNQEYLNIALNNDAISAIISTPELILGHTTKGIVIHPEPDILYGEIVNQLIHNNQLHPKIDYGIDPTATIHPTAIVSKKCKIGKHVYIGRNAIIEDYTILDEGVIIGDNVVIGCDGFYFKRDKTGKLVKFLHTGGVHLHKNVEVMTGSMVQRAHDVGFTLVEEGTKISVNVSIGHSSHIGKHNMITGNVHIAGRVKVGDYCWIGTSSTISDSITIGNNVTIRIGSVVVKNVKEDEEVSGNFAYTHSKRLKNLIKEQR